MQWGNDRLLVAIVTRQSGALYMVYLAAMSTVGSVLGCALLDLTMRPLGEKGPEKFLPPRRIERVKDKAGKNGGRALAIASLAPPPFAFNAFVMAAAALQYPRARLLSIIGATRMIRFLIVGALALRFGRRILKSRLPVVQGLLIGLIVVCMVGSIVSTYTWIKHRRSARA